MLNRGEEALPFEPYVEPVIEVNGIKVSEPDIIWENPDLSVNYSGGELYNMSRYRYYEIIYKIHKLDEPYGEWYQSTGKIKVGTSTKGTYLYNNGSTIQIFNRDFSCSATNLVISSGYYYSITNFTKNTANDMIIPYQILGYK